MSFLVPGMLAGLLALGVPVLIHLIARHRYQVQDFPSLRLIRADERTNVFALRLIDVGQLLLRLLVLLALVLGMARLFAPWGALGSAPRNLVVVVDASASMRMMCPDPVTGQRTPLIELARAKARELLAECRPPGLSALVVAGHSASGQVLAPLQARPDAAIRAVDSIEAIDGAGSGLVPAIARACALVLGRREVRSQIVVLTDLRATAFDARNQRDTAQIQAARRSLGRSLDVVLVDVASGISDNLAITEAHVRGGGAGPEGLRGIKVGDDAHVVARIVNFSGTGEKRPVKLRLTVGQRREPFVRDVALEPHGSAVVDLTTRVNRAARTFVQVEAEADDPMPHDNTFSLPLHVADVRRVLIVQESSSSSPSTPLSGMEGESRTTARTSTSPVEDSGIDGPSILRFGLNPGRELGRSQGTGMATTVIAPEALAAQALSKYDVIFLYGVSALPDSVLKDLETFVRQGRALVHIGSAGCNAMRFNRTFAAAGQDRGVLAPAELGNERVLDPPIGLAPLEETPAAPGPESAIRHSSFAIRHPVLEPFRDRLRGDLSVIRFAKIREIRNLAPTASAIFSTSNGLPLAVEMPVDRGRIVLLAFGLELDSSTLARTRVFPALLWRLMDYLTGRLKTTPPDVLVALRPAVLDVSEPGFAFAKELELVPADGKEGGEERKAGGRRPEGRGESEERGSSGLVPPASGSSSPSGRLSIAPGETCLVEGLPGGHYLLQKAQQGDAAERPEGRGARGEGETEKAELPASSLRPRPSGLAPRPSSPSSRFGYARLVAVNPDPRESDTARISDDNLTALLRDGFRTVPLAEVGRLSVRGGELWRALIVLLVLAYAAEGIIGWLLSARREKEREGGK